jgi:hypothetical protein
MLAIAVFEALAALDIFKKIVDPRISRMGTILLKFRPKFLDLYASIYGNKLELIQSAGLIFPG